MSYLSDTHSCITCCRLPFQRQWQLGSGCGFAAGFTGRQIYQDTIRLPENYESLPVEQKWVEATSRRMVASRGSPSDRLFFLGLAAAGVFGAIWFGLWQIGLTPASTQERAYISTLRDSVFAQRPAVAAALTVADSSLYTSRTDFWQIQAAFDAVSSSNDEHAK